MNNILLSKVFWYFFDKYIPRLFKPFIEKLPYQIKFLFFYRGLNLNEKFLNAIELKDKKSIEYLGRKHKKDIMNIQETFTKETPLHRACFQFNNTSKDVVKTLINQGFVINAKNSFGVTPLHLACISDKYEIVKLLISRGADCNMQDTRGESPIFRSIKHSRIKTIRYLLQHGGSCNLQNQLGDTPLHFAVFEGRKDLIPLLISHGADIFKTNKLNVSPLDLAKRMSGEEIFNILIGSSFIRPYLQKKA
jgi:ankyrin repeat protein